MGEENDSGTFSGQVKSCISIFAVRVPPLGNVCVQLASASILLFGLLN